MSLLHKRRSEHFIRLVIRARSMQNHLQSEFSRQAGPMASAKAFRAAPVIRWLTEAVASAPASRVLDLACGPGIVAQAISSSVHQVVGVDVTPEMLRLARERFGESDSQNGVFSLAQAERLPFASGCFDQVVTRLSFHHFVDPQAVFAEVRRVLRRPGRLVLADVVSSPDLEEAALHNALERLRDPAHERMLPEPELLKVVHEAGFAVAHSESWRQEREFTEWAAIVADPRRTEPLELLMRRLAQCGQRAGISLREEGGQLLFTHTWSFVIAVAS